MQKTKGVVAAGHEQTVQAAEIILQDGGNAFDAVIAAHLAACVVEPVLTSLAGGGFLLAHTAKQQNTLYDFFVQTPRQKNPPKETDFFPISANFGDVEQEFHIGLGSIAAPGTVKGLFAIQKDLCRLPMSRLAEPAIALAKDGVVMNKFQSYIFDVVGAIYQAYPETHKLFASRTESKSLLLEGERLYQKELADSIEAIAREGEDLFYRGEIAQTTVRLCQAAGGHLRDEDLKHYQVIKRKPLAFNYHQAKVMTNPAPSSGGTLIAFALKLLENMNPGQYNFASNTHLDLIAQVQGLTDKARIESMLNKATHHPGEHLLDPEYLSSYKSQIVNNPVSSRGTTHISIIDAQGNIASLTSSNGEGCGLMIPNTGIMLNNMLGEEDLNPQGFHSWTSNQRMTSMMAPSIVSLNANKHIVIGSGGSNRLRTAILQVLVNLIDFSMPLEQAINSPRIHFEEGHLSIEGGFLQEQLQALLKNYPNHKIWHTHNLFFGGTHTVSHGPDGFAGHGDPRRGGVALLVT